MISRVRLTDEKKRMIRLVVAFVVATKHHLRAEGGVHHEDLQGASHIFRRVEYQNELNIQASFLIALLELVCVSCVGRVSLPAHLRLNPSPSLLQPSQLPFLHLLPPPPFQIATKTKNHPSASPPPIPACATLQA